MPSVFISGANGGLGLSLSKTFLANDWRVFAGCLCSSSQITELSDAYPDRFSYIPMDVRDLESVSEAAQAVSQSTSNIDLLINNAGINPAKLTPLEELDFELIAATLDVNTIGPLRTVQKFLPLLKAGTGKRIANISSEAGSITGCERDAWYGYAISKAGLNRQTIILRNYLGPQGFDICAIHPGWMRSGMGSQEAPYSTDEMAQILYPLLVSKKNTDTDWLYSYDGETLPY